MACSRTFAQNPLKTSPVCAGPGVATALSLRGSFCSGHESLPIEPVVPTAEAVEAAGTSLRDLSRFRAPWKEGRGTPTQRPPTEQLQGVERAYPVAMDLSRITHNPEQCGGKPCIRGMRIRVRDILELYAAGMSSDAILADYPDLELEDLRAALDYAARALDHPVLVELGHPDRGSCHDQGSGFHPIAGGSRPSSTGHLVAAGQHEQRGLETSVEQDPAAGSGAAAAGRTLRGDPAT